MLGPFASATVDHWNRRAGGPRHGHRFASLAAVSPDLDATDGSATAVRVTEISVGLHLRPRRARWSARPNELGTAVAAVERAAAALVATPRGGRGPREMLGPIEQATCTACNTGRVACPPTVACPRTVTVSRETRETCPACRGVPRRQACLHCTSGSAPCPTCGGRGRTEDRICPACVGGRVHCGACGGQGTVEAACGTCTGSGVVPLTVREERECPTCRGSGARECPRCKGTGFPTVRTLLDNTCVSMPLRS